MYPTRHQPDYLVPKYDTLLAGMEHGNDVDVNACHLSITNATTLPRSRTYLMAASN